MLYQDRLTGMLHEVPDGQVQGFGYGESPEGVGEAQMVYDGLGNPLGFSFRRALGNLARKATPFASSLPGPWGMIASRALPMVSRAMAPSSQPRPPMQSMAPPQYMPAQMEPEPAGAEIGETPMVYSRPGTYAIQGRPPMQPMMRPPVPPRWVPASAAHWSAARPPVWSPRPQAMGPWMRPGIPAGWQRPQVPYTGVQPRRVYMRCAVWRGPTGLVPINPGQPPVAPVPAAAPPGPGRYRRRHRR
jgi:hypothetical protein